MKMRVLHLVHWPCSGIGVLVGDLIRLSGGTVEYHVIGFEGGEEEFCTVREGAASVECLHLRSRGPLALRHLRSRIEALDPHIIHTHSLQPGIWGRWLTRDRNLVATVHNAYPYFTGTDLRSRAKRKIEIRSFRGRTVRVICVSEDVRDALPPGWPAAEVVDNGVLMERVRDLATRYTADPVAGSGPLLVSAGRLESQKGYDLLLDAVAEVNRLQPVRLLLIGHGSRRAALESQAHRLGLSESIHFAGFRENPFPYLDAGDLYVSSSRFEGFGLALLEAMCLGLPVVTTTTAGMGGLLREGKTGFVADINANSIANAILRALSNPALMTRVAREGRRWVEERFHLEHTSRRYLQIYEEILGEKSAHSSQHKVMSG